MRAVYLLWSTLLKLASKPSSSGLTVASSTFFSGLSLGSTLASLSYFSRFQLASLVISASPTLAHTVVYETLFVGLKHLSSSYFQCSKLHLQFGTQH